MLKRASPIFATNPSRHEKAGCVRKNGYSLLPFSPSGKNKLLHGALVSLDHFLERVARRIIKVGNPCGVWLF